MNCWIKGQFKKNPKDCTGEATLKVSNLLIILKKTLDKDLN